MLPTMAESMASIILTPKMRHDAFGYFN